MTKRAFTMVELIFVILILGVLASVVIPTLSATRTDSMKVTLLDNLRTCILEIGAGYTATGQESLSSPSCQSVLRCFLIDRGEVLTDGEFTISTHNSSQIDENRTYCREAQDESDNKNTSKPLSLGGRVYTFGTDGLYY